MYPKRLLLRSSLSRRSSCYKCESIHCHQCTDFFFMVISSQRLSNTWPELPYIHKEWLSYLKCISVTHIHISIYMHIAHMYAFVCTHMHMHISARILQMHIDKYRDICVHTHMQIHTLKWTILVWATISSCAVYDNVYCSGVFFTNRDLLIQILD